MASRGSDYATSHHKDGYSIRNYSEFLSICEVAYKQVMELSDQYGESVVDDDMLKSAENAKAVMDSKRLSISVIGQQNSGKSTIINAMIGDEFLPMYAMTATTVRVDIQHDGSIHRGICCGSHCTQQQVESAKSAKCPWLEVSELTVAVGTNNIYKKLKEMNEHPDEYKNVKVLLSVNIPLLSNHVPQGWQLMLTDNPGLGDARPLIEQLANDSMLSSYVYIFLMETSSIGSTMVQNFMVRLKEVDKGAVEDGRLIIGIAKFDSNYDVYDQEDTRQDSVTEEVVRRKVIKSLEEISMPNTSTININPLCGIWALAASRLSTCLANDQKSGDFERILERAQRMLERCPNVDLPGGQDESRRDLIRKLDPQAIIERLNKASGFHPLTNSVYSVGNQCILLWSSKVCNQFAGLLQAAIENMTKKLEHEKRVYDGKLDDREKSEGYLKQIFQDRNLIEATACQESKEAQSILDKFKECYYSDVEALHKRKLREKTAKLLGQFKEDCKRQVTSRQLRWEEFQESLRTFIGDCEEELQQEFSSHSFHATHEYQNELNVTVTRKTEELKSHARDYINIKLRSSPGSGIEDYTKRSQRRIREHQTGPYVGCGPDLQPVRENSEMSILELTLRDKDLGVDVHRTLSDQNAPTLSDIGQRTNIRSFSLPSFLEIIVNFFRSHFRANSTPDQAPTDREPSENEAAGDANEALPKDSYIEWTDDLEETVDNMLHLINKACKKFVQEIQNDVIMYFYEEYSFKAKEYLKRFDREFRNKLDETRERLNKKVRNMEAKVQDHSECIVTLESLNDKLCNEWHSFKTIIEKFDEIDDEFVHVNVHLP